MLVLLRLLIGDFIELVENQPMNGGETFHLRTKVKICAKREDFIK
jgi:hypothetical protein